LVTEAIQLAERSVKVRRDADPLEFFGHNRHGEDVVLIKKYFVTAPGLVPSM
jgi:hypothetical protein